VTRTSVIVHGHFYQPPREDPWTDRIPEDRSASPYHDWNDRILWECYRPVTEARVLDAHGRIRHIVNTLDFMSWDAAPTLLRWLARRAPEIYTRFLEADARSRGRIGFGNAVATPYHHLILPLASRRDKITEVRWGILDFERRFGRTPEGMWLPETAVDMETLEVLAQEGIRYTILAPHQLHPLPKGGRPGRVVLGGGRELALFPYDGALAHGVAFGGLLSDADAWMSELLDRVAEREREAEGVEGAAGRLPPDRRDSVNLVALATDGESFGHHHRWGELALAALLLKVDAEPRTRLENFTSLLHRTPDLEQITLVEPSSWSCAHGIERWRAECGCRTAPHESGQQRWRAPLRSSLEGLASGIHAAYEAQAAPLVGDPWGLRDAYGSVLDAPEPVVDRFLQRHALAPLDPESRTRLRQLLEVERDALRIFTSCGWFFDDLARPEPLLLLRFAAHALDLLGSEGRELELHLREELEAAEATDPEGGNGQSIWDRWVRGTLLPPWERGAPSGPGGSPPSIASPSSGEFVALRRFLRTGARGEADALLERLPSIRSERGPSWEALQTLFAREVERGTPPHSAHLREVAGALGFDPTALMHPQTGGSRPVDLVFALHLHQPVGNFDWVFESHTDEVYLPLLQRLADRSFLPLTLHLSGPLLDWLEARSHPILELIARLVGEGSLQLLLSGMAEPVLPVLARAERREQIEWLAERLLARFGVRPTGLWLTERVWEPELVVDLAEAGITHTLLDDRHFFGAGTPRHALHRPHRTESGGRSLSILPIDEKLRYLIPFRPVAEIEGYLRELRAQNRSLAVLGDDGEKFGGWPGTAQWVWKEGWLDRFLDRMEALSEEGVLRLRRADEVLRETPAVGVTYLPSGSYREMEQWSLPAPAGAQFEELEGELGSVGLSERAAPFVRGGHWRNFLARYEESGRMHRKVGRLLALARSRGAPPELHRLLGWARCNDAYWHGVFGGLYLRHLRGAIWALLAEAEGVLRASEPLTWEWSSQEPGVEESELWIHSKAFSALIDPARAGAITEWLHFPSRRNAVDILTRHWESYHRRSPEAVAGSSVQEVSEVAGAPRDGSASHQPHAHDPELEPAGMPSIHDLEKGLGFDQENPLDPETRTLTAERVLGAEVRAEDYAAGRYLPLRSWVAEQSSVTPTTTPAGALRIDLTLPGQGSLRKRIEFEEGGAITLAYSWDPTSFPLDARFTVEVSSAWEPMVRAEPAPEECWSYEIRTVSKSERGSEETAQGISLTYLWPVSLGEARMHLGWGFERDSTSALTVEPKDRALPPVAALDGDSR